MSPSDWSCDDLELFSTRCTRISGYRHDLESHLHGLLDKHQDLGQKLHHLSQCLSNSSTRYYDPGLDEHLQKVEQELQAHHTTSNNSKPGFADWVTRKLGRNDELKLKRIKELHFHVNKHIDIAERSRMESLFNYAYPKLEYIFQKFVEQPPRNNSTAGVTHSISAHPSEHDLTAHTTAPSSSTLLPIGDRDAKTLANAPFAIRIARIVWQNRAEALDQDQNRSRRSGYTKTEPVIAPKDGIIIAKEKYVSDVLSLIEETQLDELCASSGGPSRDFLDRLANIVSQAAKLDGLPLMPGQDASQNMKIPSRLPTPPGDTATLPETKSSYDDGRSQLPTPPRTGDIPPTSQVDEKARLIPRKPVPGHNHALTPEPVPHYTHALSPRPILHHYHPFSPPINGAVASVEDAPGPSTLGRSFQVIGHSGSSTELEFPGLGPPAISSSNSESSSGRGVPIHVPPTRPSAVVLGKRPVRTQDASHDRSSFTSSWTQISCLEAGLVPSFCTLKLDSFKDKHFLLAMVTTMLSPALTADAYERNELTNSPPNHFTHRPSSTFSLPITKTYEHLILPSARPMASVRHPSYEGSTQTPARPYTLFFTEPQSLCEYTTTPRPQLVSDLCYIFSDAPSRDSIRAELFGKRLVCHAGVESIKFHYIACLKGVATLWEESASKPLTISFERNTETSKHRPAGEVEYELVTLTSPGERLEDPLTVMVRQVAGPRTRKQVPKPKECRLYFTHDDEKAAFVSILAPPQPIPGP